MKCPQCGYAESKVVDSRPSDESIRRRRECLSCGRRFTTHETIEYLPLIVVKRDGSRQTFDRGKVFTSMIRACEKRTVPLTKLEEIAAQIEKNLQNGVETEVTTDQVGEQVMAALRSVDEVAYIRFASVYRSFQNIDAFIEELTRLMDEKQ